MYTIDDLISKLIKIEEEGYQFYLMISEKLEVENKLQIVAKVFSNQEKKHMLIYEELKNNSSSYDNIEIEFTIYNRASQLISEFSKMKSNNSITDVKSLLKFALEFEKENLSLVISIAGLFVKTEKYAQSKSYIILSEIIKEEENHVKMIEDIIKVR